MVVYADVLVLLNFYIDYFLILATEKLCRSGAKVWRRLFGAIVSSLFSLVIFLPEMSPIVSLSVKIFCSAITVITVFGFKTVRDYLWRMFVFFSVSYSFAGCMLALSTLFSVSDIVVANSAFYCNISPLLLLGATTVFYLLIKLYLFISRRNRPSQQYVSLKFSYSGASANVKALVDTGNSLRDGISGAPVIVISKALAERLLGKHTVESAISFDVGEDTLSGFRLIPFSTVGKSGVLVAFKPDKVFIDGQKYSDNVYIAISPTLLCDDAQALVGPDLIFYKGVGKCCS